jgi:multidrug efflux pump subunit AcrA (membrane-fusion protein)
MKRLLIPLLAAALLAGCGRHRDDDDQPNESVEPRVPVKTAPIREGQATITIHAVGKTDALRKQKVYAPIAGIITSLRIQEGSSVRSGGTIALIRTKESQAAIAGAEALLQSAATDAQRQEAQHALDLAKRSDNLSAVKAPFDGYVAQRLVSESEVVAENAELGTLVDLSSVVVVAQVPMKDVEALKTGQSALVDFPSIAGQTFETTVDAISPQASVESQTVPVRLRFHDRRNRLKNPLRTEMIASANIITGTRPHALFVPEHALIRSDETNTSFIFVVAKDSIAHKIQVEAGVQKDSMIEIRSRELTAGLPVIIEGNYGLSDSSRVEAH